MTCNPQTRITDQQQKFCVEYLKTFNGTQAYLLAGYKCSREVARRNASRLLTNADVQSHLQTLRDRTSKQAEVTLEQTLQAIATIAFSRFTDVASFGDEGLTLKNSSDLPEEILAAIESVTFTETTTESGVTVRKSLRLQNKMTALGFLADYFGIRDDFNKARATLKRYGLALVQDKNSELGWVLEKYVPE